MKRECMRELIASSAIAVPRPTLAIVEESRHSLGVEASHQDHVSYNIAETPLAKSTTTRR